MREGDTFRLWYLAYEWDPPAGVELPVAGTAEDARRFWGQTRGRLCYAESTDGVNWERPNQGLVEYRGSGDNNILGPAVHAIQCSRPGGMGVRSLGISGRRRRGGTSFGARSWWRRKAGPV